MFNFASNFYSTYILYVSSYFCNFPPISAPSRLFSDSIERVSISVQFFYIFNRQQPDSPTPESREIDINDSWFFQQNNHNFPFTIHSYLFGTILAYSFIVTLHHQISSEIRDTLLSHPRSLSFVLTAKTNRTVIVAYAQRDDTLMYIFKNNFFIVSHSSIYLQI